jgi:hypothetical protein
MQNIIHYVVESQITKEGFDITRKLGFIPNPQMNLNVFTHDLVCS